MVDKGFNCIDEFVFVGVELIRLVFLVKDI